MSSIVFTSFFATTFLLMKIMNIVKFISIYLYQMSVKNHNFQLCSQLKVYFKLPILYGFVGWALANSFIILILCCDLGHKTYNIYSLQYNNITGTYQQLEIILRWQHLISCSSVEVKVKVVVKFGVSSLQCNRTVAEPLDLTSEKKIE